MLTDGHDCFEGEILVMLRNLRFDNSVGAPGQQRRNSDTIRIGGHDCHDLTIIAALMGGQTRIAGDGKLSACQGLAGQSITLFDANLSLDGLIAGGQLRDLIGLHDNFHRSKFTCVAFWQTMLLDGIGALGQSFRSGDTICTSGHG